MYHLVFYTGYSTPVVEASFSASLNLRRYVNSCIQEDEMRFYFVYIPEEKNPVSLVEFL